jgi:hypothetical protein
MGGYGSGRWNWHTKATTVEEALGLPTTHLREGLNRVAAGQAAFVHGTLQWSRGGRVMSSIGYLIADRAGLPVVRLIYTTTRPGGEKIDSNYQVLAVPTVPHFGGRRWWWVCPLSKNGQPCGRCVGKLYLPSGGPAFGCRQCYELTYESCQESHKYDRLWRSMGFDPAVGRLLERRYR